MRTILGLAFVGPVAILLLLAIVGAVIALVGALADLASVKQIGATMSVGGAVGFFLFALSPIGRVGGLLRGLPNDGRVKEVNVPNKPGPRRNSNTGTNGS